MESSFGFWHRVALPWSSARGTAWSQNCIQWKQVPGNGPGRVRHAMTYDSQRGVTVLFGGSTSLGGWNGDTWEYDGTTWQLRAIAGPSPREAHAMAYDSIRGVTVLYGGYDGRPVGRYMGMGRNHVDAAPGERPAGANRQRWSSTALAVAWCCLAEPGRVLETRLGNGMAKHGRK